MIPQAFLTVSKNIEWKTNLEFMYWHGEISKTQCPQTKIFCPNILNWCNMNRNPGMIMIDCIHKTVGLLKVESYLPIKTCKTVITVYININRLARLLSSWRLWFCYPVLYELTSRLSTSSNKLDITMTAMTCRSFHSGCATKSINLVMVSSSLNAALLFAVKTEDIQVLNYSSD